ncbi:hypothetical protein PSN45_003604 [Yamadazyma tenuis]|uniref:UDENN FLCN/SMCR8-type domain-containing protein n=1 Tax=Candida tenuis (strain ATCC 10573 / BCRC 21748 / CBS 615 / JCM 9827 / NBRC 10315 / NRRL Y-1498 / VKM Y-70) TaxID=590646 RepID=G3AZM5_CANTC|nr:uncharacterized protein CANTEDRAFT_101275 [Yamadazyma tenuis ATCC 10573]EGV65621.1 hypothetical protein CANTEDRAFT_101275 [Yamadazyma tenuis ATCC 10573]WEJ96069.1 hypothetical protein PSN45_003604 [Yamadazyma tenuis]
MSNYMVCLAHFCELHGPSSIMCTQVSGDGTAVPKLSLSSTTKLQTCSSCKLALPQDALNLTTKTPTKTNPNTCFVSTQYPVFQSRYTALTKLIMKSLSVETTSDLAKPLFIGDNLNGFSLTKIFKIKDVNARGGERKYCFMVVSDEEIKILKNWNIITSYLTELISSIQKKVQTSIEHKNKVDGKHSNLNNETYLRRSLVKPRSLVELTEDDRIFVKLHLGAIQLVKDMS